MRSPQFKKKSKLVESVWDNLLDDYTSYGNNRLALTYGLLKDTPSDRRLRAIIGLPKPVTRKAEFKEFKNLRAMINFTAKKRIIKKNGFMEGVNLTNKYGQMLPVREARKTVVRLAKEKTAAGLAAK